MKPYPTSFLFYWLLQTVEQNQNPLDTISLPSFTRAFWRILYYGLWESNNGIATKEALQNIVPLWATKKQRASTMLEQQSCLHCFFSCKCQIFSYSFQKKNKNSATRWEYVLFDSSIKTLTRHISVGCVILYEREFMSQYSTTGMNFS